MKILFFVSLLFISGCANRGVKPWDRDLLAKKEMQFGVTVLQDGFEDHTFFSKEGASGGRSFSAGGCGCN